MAIELYLISRYTNVFIVKLKKITPEEIVPSRQHLYTRRVTFILLILSKCKAEIVNSVVYVTIVFLSCRSGIQIFVKGGLTDFEVTVFYCRRGNSLKRPAALWVTQFRVSIFAGSLISLPYLGRFRGAAYHTVHR
jgi:hypothetical protein